MNILNGINKKVKRSNKMKKLNMSSYGVEELDANEMKDIDGGFLTMGFINTSLAIGVVAILGTMELVTQGLGIAGDSSCIIADFLM